MKAWQKGAIIGALWGFFGLFLGFSMLGPGRGDPSHRKKNVKSNQTFEMK